MCTVAAVAGHGAWADPLPTGASVVSGDVSIATPSAQSMQITQGGAAAIVNWNSFSIGSNAQVDIQQPTSDATMLNRVTGDTTSEIHGRLTANGQVYLVNPNGVFISPTGSVNAGAFVASTLNISDDDFLAGRFRFNGTGQSATVDNAGRVTIGRGGYAALLGGRVRNSGIVTVPLGKVGFASGERVTMDLSGDQFLQVTIPTGGDDQGEALIDNSGTVAAEGGLIEMRAATARQAVRHAINLSGVAEARSVSSHNGVIVLGGGAGGKVSVSGRVSTRQAPSATIVSSSLKPQERPEITIVGQDIELTGAEIDASRAGGDGLIRIGGDFAGAGDLLRADTVSIDADSTIRADALETGQGGRIVIWSDLSTDFRGSVSARGGAESGDGGFIEVSSPVDLKFAGFADTRADNGDWGTLLLDPTDVFINSGSGPTDEDTIEAALATNNVNISTSAPGSDFGDIDVSAFLDWTAATTLTLNADRNISIFAGFSAPAGGLTMFAGGEILLDADGSISVDRFSINAPTFRAEGNFTETGTGGGINVTDLLFSGDSWQQINASLPPITASNFEIRFGSSFVRALGGTGSGADPYLITDVYGLQGIATPMLSGSSFELANNINASETTGWNPLDGPGFQPISSLSATLDGAGFTISNLSISQMFSSDGIFYAPAALIETIETGGVVQDLTMTNIAVEGSSAATVAVTNDGAIRNVAVQGTVSGLDGTFDVSEGSFFSSISGGLVASNTGTIEDSIADVDVSFSIDPNSVDFGFVAVGGAVGENVGTISRTYAAGNVDVVNNVVNTDTRVGGFVGQMFSGVVQDSYALGNVDVTANTGAGDGARATAGGFVGNYSDGAIATSFSVGSVSTSGNATAFAGGFAGVDNSGSNATSNFWDTVSSGQATSAIGTGLTTAQFQDTETFLSIGAGEGWNFATVWAPGDTGFYPVNYSTTPVVLAAPDPVTVAEDETASATTTGTVSGGPDLYVFDEPGDTIEEDDIFSPLVFSDTTPGPQTFQLGTATIVSADGVSYRVIDRVGSATILESESPDDPGDTIPRPPEFIDVELPNPKDTIEGEINLGGTNVQEAQETLSTVETIAGDLVVEADACAESSGDVNRYLACLSDALNDFAGELDSIVAELPPSMQNVAQIIQTARGDIDRARARAERRLRTATTDAEREEIRRDALNEARTALSTASGEIRKSIALVRVEDPELASLHRATITTVAQAVDTVGIQLTRAVGL